MPSFPVERDTTASAAREYKNGTSSPCTGSILWRSSVPPVATISPSHVATRADPGSPTFSASLGDITSEEVGAGGRRDLTRFDFHRTYDHHARCESDAEDSISLGQIETLLECGVTLTHNCEP